MNELYNGLKARVYNVAQLSAGCGNPGARARGYLDVFDLLIADGDEAGQPVFLSLLPSEISEEGDRRVLLDGMAREYAGTQGWMVLAPLSQRV